MEVYKDISNSKNQEFKKLLIDNFSKTKIGIHNLWINLSFSMPKNEKLQIV